MRAQHGAAREAERPAADVHAPAAVLAVGAPPAEVHDLGTGGQRLLLGGVQHATQLGGRERRVQRNVILKDIAERAAGGGMGGVVAPDARVNLALGQQAREGAVRPCRAQLARKMRR